MGLGGFGDAFSDAAGAPQDAPTGRGGGSEGQPLAAGVQPVAGAQAPAAAQAVDGEFDLVDASEPGPLGERLAETVARAVRVGARELRLRLQPPELGNLNVRVVETPRGVRVSVEASTAEVAELIQQQLPLLRAALEARDLRVEQLEVRQGQPAPGGEPDAAPRERSGRGSGEPPTWSPLAAAERDGEPAPSGTPNGFGTGTVDVLV